MADTIAAVSSPTASQRDREELQAARFANARSRPFLSAKAIAFGD